MGDFPAVRQLVAQAVSPVLAGAPSPAPAPPLCPLPCEAARIDRRVKPLFVAPRGAVRLEGRAAAAARAFLSARVPKGIRVRVSRGH